MRCIETTVTSDAEKKQNTIKSNMRCIETIICSDILTARSLIKSNMRCIETHSTDWDGLAKTDKE